MTLWSEGTKLVYGRFFTLRKLKLLLHMLLLCHFSFMDKLAFCKICISYSFILTIILPFITKIIFFINVCIDYTKFTHIS